MTYGQFIAGMLSLVATAVTPLAAQDTLRLDQLQAFTQRRDPRARQLDLLSAQSAQRLRGLTTERLPQLSLSGEATHQSDVTTIPLITPTGAPPRPPKDRWQAVATLQQMLYDGGSASGRRAVERARLAESRESVRVARYRLRAEVDEAFFSAFLLQEREQELDALEEDLTTRLGVMRARVREGAALRGDVAAIEAEQLRTQQLVAEVRGGRRASLATLAVLTGIPVSEQHVLALPELGAIVTRTRAAADAGGVRDRPEFSQFARARERIGREAELTAIERRPRLYVFGQGGYGRPGLDQFNTKPDEFWIAGVRMEWRLWNWGADRRQRDALRLQQRIVQTEEEALADALTRAVQGDLENMARLDTALAIDAKIIALRMSVERQARSQFDEGAITATDYVEVRTDLLEARLDRERHRVELARSRARYLTTLGVASTGAGARP